MKKVDNLEKHFWGKVNKTNTCWVWQGFHNKKGHATFLLPRGHKSRSIAANKFSYNCVIGKEPPRRLKMLCGNLSCVNPKHAVVLGKGNKEVRYCPKCDKIKKVKHFGSANYCKDCFNRYTSERYYNNHEKIKKQARDRHRQLRWECLVAYGPCCTCCGETSMEFLAIDHINNDGAKHRKQINNANIYQWLKNNNCPKDGFQVLCHNCNSAKGFYGYCPHGTEARECTS